MIASAPSRTQCMPFVRPAAWNAVIVSKASAGLLSTTRTSIGVSDFTRKRPGEEEGDMCMILLSACERGTTPDLLGKGFRTAGISISQQVRVLGGTGRSNC